MVDNRMKAAREALRRRRPPNMVAAENALRALLERMCTEPGPARTSGLAKRLLAQFIFQEYYENWRAELREEDGYDELRCEVKIDLVTATATAVDIGALESLCGEAETRPLQHQNYRTAMVFRALGSLRSVSIESEPKKACFPKFRVRIEPHDKTGARSDDLDAVLIWLTDAKLQSVEVAFDYPQESTIDTEFVEIHAVFGKSTPNRVGYLAAYDSWGTRKGPKFVKSYWKQEVGAHRVELEFHATDLKAFRITDVAHFQKFADLLPGHQIFFGEINYAALASSLQRAGHSTEAIREIRANVREREWNLSSALNYLRRRVGLTNTRRLLRPMADVNKVTTEALEAFRAKWPEHPQLGRRRSP